MVSAERMLAVSRGRGWLACDVLTADVVGIRLSGRLGKSPGCRQVMKAESVLKGKSSFTWNQWGKSATQRHVGTGVLGQQCRQSAGCACGWAAGTVAFGAREGHRGWVMENFVYSAKKLGFCSGGEGSTLRELDLNFVLRFLKIYISEKSA